MPTAPAAAETNPSLSFLQLAGTSKPPYRSWLLPEHVAECALSGAVLQAHHGQSRVRRRRQLATAL